MSVSVELFLATDGQNKTDIPNGVSVFILISCRLEFLTRALRIFIKPLPSSSPLNTAQSAPHSSQHLCVNYLQQSKDLKYWLVIHRV